MFKKKAILLSVVLMMIPSAGYSQLFNNYLEDIYVPTGNDFGSAGPYPTDNDGIECLFSNPAAFRANDSGFTFADLTIQLEGQILNLISLLSVGINEGDFSSLLSSSTTAEIFNDLYAGVTVTGPLCLGYVKNGFGFGVFNTTKAVFEEIDSLSLGVSLCENIYLASGYAFRIPFSKDEAHALDIGFMGKVGVLGEVNLEQSLFELPSLSTELDSTILLLSPFDLTAVLGVDVGVMYHCCDFFTAAISFQDCFSPGVTFSYETGINGLFSSDAPNISLGIIPFKLNTGVEYSPDVSSTRNIISALTVKLAYDDIFEFVYSSEITNWLLHIKTGIEITLLEVLELRAGIYEGLFHMGVGIDLTFFKIDVALFGREVSSQPDGNPVYNMIIGLKF
ncbi:MAG: hypothetical protein PQJ46_13670 [Spirochaetales bacterium]|nr:hypothetical protein [Spirochaetales bacterium]